MQQSNHYTNFSAILPDNCTMAPTKAAFIRDHLELVTCSICLGSEFQKKDKLVQISNHPECSHIFGKFCLLKWLSAKDHKYPLCRSVLCEPTPMESHPPSVNEVPEQASAYTVSEDEVDAGDTSLASHPRSIRSGHRRARHYQHMSNEDIRDFTHRLWERIFDLA
jgi:hypothetical protein